MKKSAKIILTLLLLAVQAPAIFTNPALDDKSGYSKLEFSERKITQLPSFWALLKQEFPLGVKHIFTGIDHIAFIIALTLMMLRMRHLVVVVTWFTLAHALTLTLYSLNIIQIGRWGVSIIEILVALSIAWVGVENLLFLSKHKENNQVFNLKRTLNFNKDANPGQSNLLSVKNRSIVAFLFGLIHGIAFSEHFREFVIDYDFSQWAHVAKLLFAVISFNLGVDVGQLVIAFAVFFLLYFIDRKISSQQLSAILQKKVILYMSALIAILGSGWFVQRILELR